MDIQELLTPLAIAIIGIIFSWVKSLPFTYDKKIARILSFVEAGVCYTYETYVREIKEKSWKLNDGERYHARQLAVEYALKYAKENGLDITKYFSKEEIPAIVERIIAEKKQLNDIGV